MRLRGLIALRLVSGAGLVVLELNVIQFPLAAIKSFLQPMPLVSAERSIADLSV